MKVKNEDCQSLQRNLVLCAHSSVGGSAAHVVQARGAESIKGGCWVQVGTCEHHKSWQTTDGSVTSQRQRTLHRNLAAEETAQRISHFQPYPKIYHNLNSENKCVHFFVVTMQRLRDFFLISALCASCGYYFHYVICTEVTPLKRLPWGWII